MRTAGLLFYPKWRSALVAWRRVPMGRAAPVALITVAFWAAIFGIFYRMLVYFRSVEDIGTLLTVKLVSMTLISLVLVLVFSNLVCAFTTFFFSEDLHLLISSPVSLHRVYLARYAETGIHASWMVFIMAVPIFAALGTVFGAGWGFYLGLPAAMVPLAMIPTALGIILALLLVNVFMARRTRDVLSFLSVIGLGALIVAFRFLQPEKLAHAPEMKSVVDFFVLLRSPESPLSPHFWVSQVLLDYLGLRQSDSAFFLILLWAVALGCLSLGYYAAALLYRRGYSRAQEADTRRIREKGFWSATVSFYLRPLPRVSRELVLKDLKALARDKSQWSQLLLLAGLIVVYLYNFSVMPLDRSPIPRYVLETMMIFLNLGLAGFVLASIAARFVFPGVSMEGKSFWLLRSAPVSVERFLWSKMLVLAFPLAVLGQFLVYMTSHILKVSPPITVLACAVVLTLTLAIVGLGTGMGAAFPRFDVENPSQIPTGFGGIVYMIASLAVIGATLALLARPVQILLVSRVRETPLNFDQWAEIALFFAAVAAVHFAVLRVAMTRGARALGKMEI